MAVMEVADLSFVPESLLGGEILNDRKHLF